MSVWKIWFYRVHNLNRREFQQKPNKKVNKREKEKRTTSLVFISFCIIFVSLSKCVQNLPLNRKKGIPQTQKHTHTHVHSSGFSHQKFIPYSGLFYLTHEILEMISNLKNLPHAQHSFLSIRLRYNL